MKVELRPLTGRLWLPFRHHHTEHRRQNSLLVRLFDDHHQGWGEGCPRPFIHQALPNQGAPKDAQRQLQLWLQQWQAMGTELAALAQLSEQYSGRYPAYWCAFELAALHWLAEHQGQDLDDLLGVPKQAFCRQTAIYPACGDGLFRLLKLGYGAHGLRHCKLKWAGQPLARRIAQLTQPHIRVDANNGFGSLDQALIELGQYQQRLSAVEEPFAQGQLHLSAQLAEQLGVQIILDESLYLPKQAQQAKGGPFIMNLRLSKVGGWFAALRLADLWRSYQQPLLIGCQVAEGPVLSRFSRRLLAQQQGVGHIYSHELGWNGWLRGRPWQG